MTLDIRIVRPESADVIALLERHLAFTAETSPEESVHALDPEELARPDVTFWTLRDDGRLVGCIALKRLSPSHGEIKSMHVAQDVRGRGLAAPLLEAVIEEAESAGMRRLSLETGSDDSFAPARGLYSKFGFVECPPFGDYVEDPYSIFMTRELAIREAADV